MRLIYLILKVLMIRRVLGEVSLFSETSSLGSPKTADMQKVLQASGVSSTLFEMAPGSVQNAAPDHECTKPRHFRGLWDTSSFLVVWTSVPYRSGDSK